MQIPFHKTHTSQEEIDAVTEAIKSGWLTMGPKTIEFENEFKAFLGIENAVSMNSATAALHLSLKAIGLKEGEEVIMPTNTFIATAEVITYFNAIPVLCDIEADTFNIDTSKIEALITSKTRAIIPVHIAGQACDMDEIYAIAKKHNLKVIEDAAHAMPTTYKGELIGNLAGTDITCFSFYATKTLSTGEGGMATTSNEQYTKSMKINRLHGISRDAWDRYTAKGNWFYEIVDNGYKYNTTDLNASLGLVQLKKQMLLKDKRKAVAEKYTKAFEGNKNIETPFQKSDRESSWHLYIIKVDNRDEVITKLKELGVGCSVHFIPVHKQPFYKSKFNFINENYPVANSVFEKVISLPIYPDMLAEEIQYVIDSVVKVTA